MRDPKVKSAFFKMLFETTITDLPSMLGVNYIN